MYFSLCVIGILGFCNTKLKEAISPESNDLGSVYEVPTTVYYFHKMFL